MPADLLRSDIMIAIAVMGLVTVALRLSGFWLMGFVPVTPCVRRMLDALPGSVIAACVLPVVVSGGIVAALAVISAMVLMWFTRNDFAAVMTGMGVAALARLAGLG